jgi:predicted Zn-dependent protease
MHAPRVIQIVPIGPVAREDLLASAATTKRVFGAEAVVMPAIPLPIRALRADRDQFDADAVLDTLFDKLSLDVCRVVGVTEVDLFAEGRNFVFGYAHMRDRVAVFSTCRLKDAFWGRHENPAAYALRIDKALVHELGHTFHAPHCTESRCVMRQVEHLWQLDELAMDLCVSCNERISVVASRGVDGAESLFELAGSYMRRRRYAKAVAAYSAACALDPPNPHYANDLGVALLAIGERGGAARTFERAIFLNPELPHAYYNLGIVFRESGDVRQADKLFTEALSRDPDIRQAHRYLGILHQDYFQDPSRALAYLERFVALGGEDLEVQRRLKQIRRDVDPRGMEELACTSRRLILEG